MDDAKKEDQLHGVYNATNYGTNITPTVLTTTPGPLPAPLTASNNRKSLFYHLYTLVLFTKSDFKVVIIPQSVFVLSAAYSVYTNNVQHSTTVQSPFQPIRLALTLFWLWTHLLLENIANQRLPSSIREDGGNKPWRPLPAGRITTQQCQALLRIGVPLGLTLSVLLDNTSSSSVILASAIVMCMMWLYNDLEGDSAGPLQRGAVNGVALACFSWGALGVLVPEMMDGSSFVESVWQTLAGGVLSAAGKLQVWTVLIAVVVTTTVHAQDFSDIVGDRERGRQTMPILYGQTVSRWALAVASLVWSVVALQFWGVAIGLHWVPTIVVGGSMAGLVVMRNTYESDKIVWQLWCLWMVVLFTMPLLGGSM